MADREIICNFAVDLRLIKKLTTDDRMDKIEIKGYKSIQDMELTLKPLNLLIGANGSGKTNFLSFFEFLRNIYMQNLRGYVAERGVEKILHRGPKVTEEISSKLSFGKNKYSFTIKSTEAGFVFTKEGLWYGGNPYVSNPMEISSMSYESNLRHATVERAKYIRNYLGGLVKYHFHDTSANSPFTQTSNVENDKYLLYSKGQNLAAFLYNIHEEAPLSYNLIVGTVQSIAPYFGDFYLHPTPTGQIRLQWTSRYSETIYGPTDLSDGTIRFIALATLFLQPSLPATIIIDEPELGLHPAAITKLAGIMKSASGKDCQIIAATQSADLLSHFLPNDIVAVDLVDGASRFQRLNNEALSIWLDNYYPVDELWKRNILSQGQPNI